MHAGGQATNLIGTWESDPSDAVGNRSYGKVTLKFCADSTLLYIAHEAGREQVIRLTFRIEPGLIVTDQPSHPHFEKTRFEFMPDGRLLLAFGGKESTFVRVA
jgi:hypothetical protein